MGNLSRLRQRKGLDALVLEYVMDMKSPPSANDYAATGEWLARQKQSYDAILKLAGNREKAVKLVNEALQNLKLFGV